MKLENWKRADVRTFKSKEPRFKNLRASEVADLYHQFSEETACAGWLFLNDKRTEQFIEWCFESPVEKILRERKLCLPQ